MTPHKDTPVYNLKAVVQETGLKADTLRAWERRYGIPSPQRASSGHRLYSQNDIEMLHWLIARQEEGLSISRAIELWQRMHESGEQPTIERPALVAPPSAAPAVASSSAAVYDDVVQERCEAWIAACLRFDELAAEQVLSQAFALFPPEVVCLEIIQYGLARIGEGWYRGRVTVQQEHFASSLALRRLESMIAATPPPTRPGRILIGLPPEEQHTFVSLMTSLLLRRRGWDTIYLGANVPVANFAETIASTRPSLVILTAQQLHTAASLLEMAEVLLHLRIPLAFGGLVFNQVPDLPKAIPGHYLGPRLDYLVSAVEQLMGNLRLQLAQRVPGQEYRAALLHFRQVQSSIEAGVWRRFQDTPITPRMLAAGNQHFSANIAAALALGNLDYMSADYEWIDGLLIHHAGMPPSQLDLYLQAYLDSASEHLDARGKILIAWLATLVGDQAKIDDARSEERVGHPWRGSRSRSRA